MDIGSVSTLPYLDGTPLLNRLLFLLFLLYHLNSFFQTDTQRIDRTRNTDVTLAIIDIRTILAFTDDYILIVILT